MSNDVTMYLKFVTKLYLVKRYYNICRNNVNSFHSYLLALLVYSCNTVFTKTWRKCGVWIREHGLLQITWKVSVNLIGVFPIFGIILGLCNLLHKTHLSPCALVVCRCHFTGFFYVPTMPSEFFGIYMWTQS